MGRTATYINLEESGKSCTEAAVKECLNSRVGMLHEFVSSCTYGTAPSFFDQMMYYQLSASLIGFSVI
jgi:hypothetical protein